MYNIEPAFICLNTETLMGLNNYIVKWQSLLKMWERLSQRVLSLTSNQHTMASSHQWDDSDCDWCIVQWDKPYERDSIMNTLNVWPHHEGVVNYTVGSNIMPASHSKNWKTMYFECACASQNK